MSTGLHTRKLCASFKNNILTILLSICINICALALPIYTIQVYDRIIVQRNISTFIILTIGAVFFVFLEFVFRLLRSYLAAYYVNKEKHISFVQAIKQFARISPDKLIDLDLHKKMELINELSSTHEFIYRQFYISLVDGVFLLLLLSIITLLSYQLGLVVSLILIVFIIKSTAINKQIIKEHKIRNQVDEKRMSGIVDYLRSLSIVKNFANEELLKQKQDITERHSVINTFNSANTLAFLYNFTTFSSQILVIATLTVGALNVKSGIIQFGTLIAITLIVGRMTAPIREMLSFLYKLHLFANTNQKLVNFYKESTREYPIKKIDNNKKEALVLCHVCIKENVQSSNYSIDKLSLTIDVGESIVISYLSNKQHNLLKNALTGMLTLDKGDIMVFDAPMVQLSSEQYYQNVAYFGFDNEYIKGSIKTNITGDRMVSDEALDEVCSLFNLNESINELEHGIETQLDATTIEDLPLSFRTKILLARVYLYQPKIIIIDTYSSYMTAEVYQLLLHFFKKVKVKSAILMLSNDENLIALADYQYDIRKNQLMQRKKTRLATVERIFNEKNNH